MAILQQSDGNFVQDDRNGNQPNVLWASGTNGSGAVRATMQTDGNFVLYNAQGQAVWATRTNGNPGAYMIMQGDGNLVIYAANGTWLWSSWNELGWQGLYFGPDKIVSGPYLGLGRNNQLQPPRKWGHYEPIAPFHGTIPSWPPSKMLHGVCHCTTCRAGGNCGWRSSNCNAFDNYTTSEDLDSRGYPPQVPECCVNPGAPPSVVTGIGSCCDSCANGGPCKGGCGTNVLQPPTLPRGIGDVVPAPITVTNTTAPASTTGYIVTGAAAFAVGLLGAILWERQHEHM
jgi:hypothetical protein